MDVSSQTATAPAESRTFGRQGAMADGQWAQMEVPPVPPKHARKFVAHSVVATPDPSRLMAPHYTWRDVEDYANRSNGVAFDMGSHIMDYNISIDILATLPKVWRCQKGDIIVSLGCGTAVLCRKDGERRKFEGFATPASMFGLPHHRFSGGVADVADILLAAEGRLQKTIERYEKDPIRLGGLYEAMRTIEDIGYLRPGSDESDANVTALWACSNRPRLFLAAVRCRGFGDDNVLTVVAMNASGTEPIAYENMRDFADAGRDSYRNDILGPVVISVDVCGEDFPEA